MNIIEFMFANCISPIISHLKGEPREISFRGPVHPAHVEALLHDRREPARQLAFNYLVGMFYGEVIDAVFIGKLLRASFHHKMPI